MVAAKTPEFTPDAEADAFAARLARAAYDVALRHGLKGPFTDLELALWRELREVVRTAADAQGTPCVVLGDAG